MSEFAQYIGLPWEQEYHDCAEFARRIQRDHFGVVVPPISLPDYSDVKGIVEFINGHPENDNWVTVGNPQHGDIVVIRKPAHYGVWIDVDGGGVLHCVEGIGVIFTHDSAWRMSGFGRREYLRHRSKI